MKTFTSLILKSECSFPKKDVCPFVSEREGGWGLQKEARVGFLN